MNGQLQQDMQQFAAILQQVLTTAQNFLEGIDEHPAAVFPPALEALNLPETGQGALDVLSLFASRYSAHLSGSVGARYWGFVTGGTTPAALAGDWLASTYDQNVTQYHDSAAAFIEQETIRMLCHLFGLPDSFTGYFVSGATMSNFTALALARQWVAGKHGIDLAESGFWEVPRFKIVSAKAHSSVFKAVAMLGIGRQSIQSVATLDGREAIDIGALHQTLSDINAPCIVVASAGTVNTVDFDDIRAIAELKQEFDFWLHVDGAFGGFAACSPAYKHLVAGWEQADSITVDGHKWLNVPYDSAMVFTPHQNLLYDVFRNSAAYLGEVSGTPDPVHMQPQNSRRFRALPAWFTLMAYGRDGYQSIVEEQINNAKALGERINASEQFELLAEVRLNVVCFTLTHEPTPERCKLFLNALQESSDVFITPTVYAGKSGFRAAFSSWRTDSHDLDIAWNAMLHVVDTLV